MELRAYEPGDAAVVAGRAGPAEETRRWCGLDAAHSGTVVLRVHPSNAGALRCYAGAGFSRVPPAEADEWNQGQPVAYTWLRW